jgi:hypothetical protein
MSVNTDYIFQNVVDAGLATVDVRDVRGWSPWHQHETTSAKATFVTPRDRDAFVLTLQKFNDAGISYELIGGGTATTKPSGATVFIVTSGLDSLAIDHEKQELLVGAGVAIDVAEGYVAEHGWTLGQWLGSGGTATIGGAIATKASGILAGRYGILSDAVTDVEIMDSRGNTNWVNVSTYKTGSSHCLLAARVPLWLSPDGRAVARFAGAVDPLVALRQVATARLLPAHISVDQSGLITIIVEGEPHLETARYQLIAAILQKHGAVQDATLDQSKHWDTLLSANPWSANAAKGTWADRIVQTAEWPSVNLLLETWRKRAERAGAELTWRAVNPTANGVQLILDFRIAEVTNEPGWLYGEA